MFSLLKTPEDEDLIYLASSKRASSWQVFQCMLEQCLDALDHILRYLLKVLGLKLVYSS